MSFGRPRPIKDYAVGIYDGPHATPSESSDGAVFLGIKNITEDGRLDLTEIRHVSEETSFRSGLGELRRKPVTWF